MIIAVDFDGTLFDDDKFPEIGEPKKDVISWVLKQQQNGHQTILWTCREGRLLHDAIESCKSEGLHFHAINENLPELKFSYLGKSKVIADLYLDDKSGNIAMVTQLDNANEFIRG